LPASDYRSDTFRVTPAAPVSRLFPGRRDHCRFFHLVIFSLSTARDGLSTNVRPLEQNSEARKRRKRREEEEEEEEEEE